MTDSYMCNYFQPLYKLEELESRMKGYTLASPKEIFLLPLFQKRKKITNVTSGSIICYIPILFSYNISLQAM